MRPWPVSAVASSLTFPAFLSVFRVSAVFVVAPIRGATGAAGNTAETRKTLRRKTMFRYVQNRQRSIGAKKSRSPCGGVTPDPPHPLRDGAVGPLQAGVSGDSGGGWSSAVGQFAFLRVVDLPAARIEGSHGHQGRYAVVVARLDRRVAGLAHRRHWSQLRKWSGVSTGATG